MPHKLNIEFDNYLVDVPIIQIKCHLEDPEYPHDPDKPEHLAHPAHHQRVLHTLQHEAEVVREDGQQVDNVQRGAHEGDLVGSAGESDEVFCNIIDNKNICLMEKIF